MKVIVCKNGESCLVDNEDFDWLNQYRWKVKHNKCGSYAYRTFSVNKKAVTVWMHKELFGIYKKRSKKRVDHRDFNGLNNQKYNLRVCTHAQNNCYKRSAKNSTSRFLGVSFDKQTKNWAATIYKNYRQKRLGRFEVEEDAALAYNEAAKVLHGEFANLNKV